MRRERGAAARTCERLLERLTTTRWETERREHVEERREREGPLLELHVRDRERVIGDPELFAGLGREEEIEVERARSPARHADPTEDPLDGQRGVEERARREGGLECDGGVHEVGLRRTHGRRRIDLRAREDGAELGDRPARPDEDLLAGAEVRSEPDHVARHARR